MGVGGPKAHGRLRMTSGMHVMTEDALDGLGMLRVTGAALWMIGKGSR